MTELPVSVACVLLCCHMCVREMCICFAVTTLCECVVRQSRVLYVHVCNVLLAVSVLLEPMGVHAV